MDITQKWEQYVEKHIELAFMNISVEQKGLNYRNI